MDISERIAFQNHHWGQGRFETYPFRRAMFARVWRDIDTNLIALVTGPRRTGKSVLLKQLIHELIGQKQVPPTQILFFEFSPGQSSETIWQVYHHFTSSIADPRRPVYLFFDEIQYLNGYEIVIKELYDNTSATKIFLTGSLSLTYKQRMKESLSGRFFPYQLFPLCFEEYLQLALPENYPRFQQAQTETNPFVRQRLLGELNADFRHFLAWGRLPEMINLDQAQAKTYLQTVLSQSLHQDAFAYFSITKPPLMNALFDYLCLNSGGLLSVNSLSSELGVSSVTLTGYLDVLEQMGLVYMISNTTHPLRRTNASRKAYVSSMFALLRTKLEWPNALGLAVESYVLERLLERGETATFYRQRAREVDFLLPEKKIGYEVKFRPRPEPVQVEIPDFSLSVVSLDETLPACLF